MPVLYSTCLHPTWKQFIGERIINSQADAENYINKLPLGLYQKYDYGPWLVKLSDTLQPIDCAVYLNAITWQVRYCVCVVLGSEGCGLVYKAGMAA